MNDSLLSDSKFYSTENAGSSCAIFGAGRGSQLHLPVKTEMIKYSIMTNLTLCLNEGEIGYLTLK